MAEKISEALVAQPLPEMIQNLAMAVVEANAAVKKSADDTEVAIHTAEIEIQVALSLARGSEWEVGGGGSIYGFSLNASYARTYNFKEEASSRIKIVMSATPRKSEPGGDG